MRALDRKLLRELLQLRGQVVTIALVVACGIASFVTLRSTWSSLETSKREYYLDYRFGDVFAHLKRAPEAVVARLEQVPGVALVYARLVQTITLPIQGRGQPPVAEVVSLPPGGEPPLGALFLQAGRLPAVGRADEAVLLTSFADHYDLAPGDTVSAILNGERREVLIVGLATSPEFVYPTPPGGLGVDDERFAVLWMDRTAIAPAFQMEGAFNDVVIRLQHGASEPEVLSEVDRILDPYGGLSAVGRSQQPSNYILEEEMAQLRMWATVVPLIFLGVSAFLVNVVLSRLVHLQRPQIAALKAVGYRDVEVGLHYLKLVSVVVLLGAVLGVAVGAWLGRSLTGVYAHIFRFPYFEYALGVGVPLAAAALSFASAAVGAVATVRRIVLLPPAEAMRPPAPSVYRPLLLEQLGLGRLVSPAGRMVVRELERQPLRTVLSVLGIATALGTLIVGQFTGDAFRYLIQVQFSQVTREDLSVELRDPVAARAARELAHLPGVWRAEGVRTVPVRIEAGHRYREIPLVGYEDGAQLRRVISRDTRRPVPLPPAGLVVTRTLGEVLGVGAGDTVLVKLLQGERAVLPMIVAGMVDELVGLQGYLRLPALNALLAEPPTVSQVLLAVEGGRTDAVIRRLGEMPGVSTITRRSAVVELIERQSGESMAVVSLVLTIFAATIAVGVVYNNARVVLSLRSRDLASLRVLGFSRAEISRVLLNELGLQVLLAIPTGMVIGTWLTGLVVRSIHQERFRFPVVLSARTYAFAILVVLAASAASALLVRRGLDRLDLIGVLKTRE